ncbi:MAG TPA: alpha-glucuronidase family glycosyl hydrolase [Acidobacteriaceae bacterium]|nr:alpha-glucuronidase family glycosyl hydrolase [Acidobacteriaceae bacterium]
MKRRSFLRLAAAAALAPEWVLAQESGGMDLRQATVVIAANEKRGEKMAQVLVEEAEKRCGLRWDVQNRAPEHGAEGSRAVLYLATSESVASLGRRISVSQVKALPQEGFVLRSGGGAEGPWIAVVGADQRGLLFGIGKLLRLIHFARQQAWLPGPELNQVSHPEYKLRGHQLGYRPKTNAYDAWSAEMWDQYIRDLAIFGTNAIELIPPKSDDLPDSPHFPLPPLQMMIEMSRIADSYGLDVWAWYPAMDKDYGNPATVQSALEEWANVFDALPRLDAVLVPGGDPGHTRPKDLLALLEKQKESLRRRHPKAQMWVSPQGFSREWMQEFLDILHEDHTKQWLDGVVFGPMSRLTVQELRRALPENYSIRCYPDITHSVQCQYPVPDWDIAYALTEGREVINPRPRSEAAILRQILPGTVGFISYSEGCNDDVNKFVWSALAWDSKQTVNDVTRDFAQYFIGSQEAEGFAQGLLQLETNWQGPLLTNAAVENTLESFQDMEQSCSPAVMENWRFQQALYRAYFDAFVRRRLLEESAHVVQARDLLERLLQIGWGPIPLGIGAKPAALPPNGLRPETLLAETQSVLDEAVLQPAGADLRLRVRELAAALFQSIRMQLAVERYDGEAVDRAANLDTLDAPVSDVMWMRREIEEIRKESDPMKQIAASRELLYRTDPGPGGYYDELGNTANRPHLLVPQEKEPDPDFRYTPLIGCSYPDHWQDRAPMAWKHWAGALYDAPLRMRYSGLNRESGYRLRVVYSGDAPQVKLRLVANDSVEIHPLILRTWPPAPQEFAIPAAATAAGELTLTWTREQGLGGNGRGCQVAEVWLIPNPATEHA